MSPQRHLLCGTILAAGIMLRYQEADTALACIAGSVLCDTDHILEYAKYCNDYDVKPNIHEFLSGRYFDTKKTVYVLLHSWEVVVIGILYCVFESSPRHILKGLTLGYTSHMLLDQIGNKARPYGYFWLYRWWKDWRQCRFS